MDIGQRFRKLTFIEKIRCFLGIFFKKYFNIDMSFMLGIENIEKKLIFGFVKRRSLEIYPNLKKNILHCSYQSSQVKINCWYIKAKDNKPTILYFHGQGEHLSEKQDVFDFLTKKGYGLFAPQYRGHGECFASSSEELLYLDANEAVNFLKNNFSISLENIIIWGKSLGGAVAIPTSIKSKPLVVIIESTFTSLPDLIKSLSSKSSSRLVIMLAKYFPVSQKFDTLSIINQIECPLLVGHSKNDYTVSYTMAEKLSEKNQKAVLYIAKSGAHEKSDWFFEEVERFLSDLEKIKGNQINE